MWGGQNKNRILIAMCARWLLSTENITDVELVFPVRGHSFMPSDRVFGVCEKEFKQNSVKW